MSHYLFNKLWGFSVRYKLSDERRSVPVPISLRPMHLEMLKELEQDKRANRSSIIQSLIEKEYKLYINGIVEKGDVI